jgi:HEAT repeat protein
MAWAATALIGFGIGWMSRATIPLRPEMTPVKSVVQPDRAISLLPAGIATFVDPKIAPPIQVSSPHRSRLADENPAFRITAAKTLLKANPHHAKALKTLLAILVDPLSKMHLAAIEALSTTGASDPEVVSSLARALGDDDPSVACAAATTLGRLGKLALPAANDLVLALNYKDGSVPSVSRAATEALTGFGELAVPALNKGLNDLKIKPQALVILARIVPPPSPEPTPAVLSQGKAPSTDPDTDLDELPDVDTVQAAAAHPANDLSTIH